jgi:hypothetical protein
MTPAEDIALHLARACGQATPHQRWREERNDKHDKKTDHQKEMVAVDEIKFIKIKPLGNGRAARRDQNGTNRNKQNQCAQI